MKNSRSSQKIKLKEKIPQEVGQKTEMENKKFFKFRKVEYQYRLYYTRIAHIPEGKKTQVERKKSKSNSIKFPKK